MDQVALAILWYMILLISVVFHEAAHGFAAMKLGDLTAYHSGQVTLDPLPHIKREPIGTVVLPIISYILAGWMIGWASVPYDRYWAQRHRRRAALMSLAGPAANIALVVVAALLIRAGMLLGFFSAPESITFARITESVRQGPADGVATAISVLFSLNLILFVFNLIPLPPLDGSGVLMFFLSEDAAQRYEGLMYNPTNRMIGLVVAWQMFAFLFEPVHLLAINLLYPGTGYN